MRDKEAQICFNFEMIYASSMCVWNPSRFIVRAMLVGANQQEKKWRQPWRYLLTSSITPPSGLIRRLESLLPLLIYERAHAHTRSHTDPHTNLFWGQDVNEFLFYLQLNPPAPLLLYTEHYKVASNPACPSVHGVACEDLRSFWGFWIPGYMYRFVDFVLFLILCAGFCSHTVLGDDQSGFGYLEYWLLPSTQCADVTAANLSSEDLSSP